MMIVSDKYTTFELCGRISHIRLVGFGNKFKFKNPLRIIVKFKIRGKNEELWLQHIPDKKFNTMLEIVKYILENQESKEVKYKIINIDEHKF